MTAKSDKVAAANLIERKREYNRKNQLHKSISIWLFDEGERGVYNHLCVTINRRTGNISFSHPLWYGREIHPSTFEKCEGYHALEVLKHQRKVNRKYQKKNKLRGKNSIRFYSRLEKNAVLSEEYVYNPQTGSVYCITSFFGNNISYQPKIDSVHHQPKT